MCGIHHSLRSRIICSQSNISTDPHIFNEHQLTKITPKIRRLEDLDAQILLDLPDNLSGMVDGKMRVLPTVEQYSLRCFRGFSYPVQVDVDRALGV